ncbi:MAG: hypothetical protein NC299_06650 [Lachnospiraceae bacterium]|nr:hypothetical protein [Ruminococcus sp.]MCM1275033.1 hypothetical protein [Lachnospiraceae bacterium]
MVEIICKDDMFLVKGSFTLGLAGTFVNESFEDENISIEPELDDILEELEDEESFAESPLFPFLKDKPLDGDSIAEGLAAYINQKEKEAAEHVAEINDNLLFHLFEDLEGCAYPFWEIEEAVAEGYDPEELDESIYRSGNVNAFSDYFDKRPNNGTVERVDFETKLREWYPMFNFDGLYENIEPEAITFDGEYLEFQFSDKWGAQLFQCAYDRFDENFTSCDWHNH